MPGSFNLYAQVLGDNLRWNFDPTTTDSDPGDYGFRFNHATLASATFIYVDDLPESGVDMGSALSAMAAGNHVYMESGTAGAALFELSGAPTDGTGYWKIPVTHVSGTPTLPSGLPVFFRFLGGGGVASGPVTVIETADFTLDPDVHVDGCRIVASGAGAGLYGGFTVTLPLIADQPSVGHTVAVFRNVNGGTLDLFLADGSSSGTVYVYYLDLVYVGDDVWFARYSTGYGWVTNVDPV